MIEPMVWGVALRVAQAVVQATPTILVGLVVAGIFRRLLGHENTRRLFGWGTWRELPQAWLIGMLLPVCSLGVIPVAREMRRARISGGTTLAFAITAPLFNPLSMLYGLTLSEPSVLLVFAFCSMLVVTLVGGLWDRLFADATTGEPEPRPVSHGLKRMASIVVVAAREVVGPSLVYILIGLFGVALLGVVLPPGSLQSTMEHENRFAPLAMVGVSLPAYASPLAAMSQIGSMFQHANSVGAAFVLLTLGAGVNLGTIAWGFRNYGVARGVAWLALLLAVVIGLAYAIEGPLFPDEIEPPGHTHAFDIYCRPFHSGTWTSLPPLAIAKLKEGLDPVGRVGLIVLSALIVLGVAFRALDQRWRVEDWLEKPTKTTGHAPGWLNLSIPPAGLGGIALAGLVAFSIVGCFAYYPTPREVFDEMAILRGEVLSAALTGDQKHAARLIPIWDDWTRRLQVGTFLRQGRIGPYRRMKAKVFRDRLEMLKHAVEEGDRDESRDYVRDVSEAYWRMRLTYLSPG